MTRLASISNKKIWFKIIGNESLFEISYYLNQNEYMQVLYSRNGIIFFV